jgi:hypothetical protein
MNGVIVIPPLLSVGITAQEDAHKPTLLASIDDLSNLTSQEFSFEIWHTEAHSWPQALLEHQGLKGRVGERAISQPADEQNQTRSS